MTLIDLISQIKNTPEDIHFQDVIACIDTHYQFTPRSFQNGSIANAANQNNGSCKIFAFASLHGFSEAETLACFGAFFRDDVLKNPDGNDHQNIRNFMQTGWAGIVFEGEALQLK
jgi:HopJ type III effector protein